MFTLVYRFSRMFGYRGLMTLRFCDMYVFVRNMSFDKDMSVYVHMLICEEVSPQAERSRGMYVSFDFIKWQLDLGD